MLFADPWLLLLALFAPLVVFSIRRIGREADGEFRFSNGKLLKGLGRTFRVKLYRSMVYLRALALVFIAIALARPQSFVEKWTVHTEGVDIVLALDVSTSMMAHDLKLSGARTDRLEVIKKVVRDFIEKRPNDRIGIIAFAGYAYTVCPLTLDHEWLKKNLERVEISMIEDGTAIGSAVMGALNRLDESPSKERVIILLTDGRNNAGRISPDAAAEAAEALGVRFYAGGVGTRGLAPFPVQDMFGNTVMRPVNIEIDEDTLKKMAATAEGEYFRATSTEELEKFYARIDELEKSELEHTGYRRYTERFALPLALALFVLLLELVLSKTVARRIP